MLGYLIWYFEHLFNGCFFLFDYKTAKPKTGCLRAGDFFIPVDSQNKQGPIKISKKLRAAPGVIVMIRGMNR